MRIDTHQHFWIYDKDRDSWITEEMSVIQRNFLPNDISQTLKNNNIDGVVAVQASQSHQETYFLTELSQVYKMIKGVVGWVDLRSSQIEAYLEEFRKHDIIKGFRHVIEGEPDGDFLIKDDFLRGIESLTAFDYTCDLLIRPHHYQSTLECVRSNPNQKFILDHMAKPAIKTKEFEDWAVFIEALSNFPNVYCKISGLVTEADWKNWELDHFTPYINHVIKSFGKDRICFGTDWPVCLIAASYEQCIEIVQDKMKDFTAKELEQFWGLNAVKFYNLK